MSVGDSIEDRLREEIAFLKQENIRLRRDLNEARIQATTLREAISACLAESWRDGCTA